MQTQRVGKTDLKVSQIGLGTVKFGRTEGLKYPDPFTLPTDKELKNLLALAKDLGINLLDTAPAYGASEDRLGKLLHLHRHDWVISTKVGEEFVDGKSQFDFSKQRMQLSVERSLKRLRTDYLDVVLVHSNGDDQSLIEEEHVFHTLQELKQAGKLRAFGMSTKTLSGGLLSVQMADVVMVSFNPVYDQEREVIQSAHQHQKGIFVKKALASGHLDKIKSANPVLNSLQFVFSEPGVSSAIVGTINPLHLRQLVETLADI